MSSSAAAPPSPANGVRNPNCKPLGFVANALKRKSAIVQFFARTGILLLSFRSLGQKYHMHNLIEDTAALKEEQESLTARMSKIKESLLAEADREPSGTFAARLRVLFADESN